MCFHSEHSLKAPIQVLFVADDFIVPKQFGSFEDKDKPKMSIPAVASQAPSPLPSQSSASSVKKDGDGDHGIEPPANAAKSGAAAGSSALSTLAQGKALYA